MKNNVFSLESIRNFFKSGLVGGILLLSCVIISLIVANSTLGPGFESFLAKEVGYQSSNLDLKFSLLNWVNDGLMAIFFLLVGLEIKRELVEGELSSPKKAALPILAAIGGALVPALIFTLLNHGQEAALGWGIPMATDIAFALAIVTLLGKSVPPSLKIFLAALAIVDDLLAILVIAIFYSTELHFTYLLYAGLLVGLLFLFNKKGVTQIYMYLIPGVFIWYFIHHSGIHATIAGVLVAFTLPLGKFDVDGTLERLEHILLKPVNFFIMPVFALVNTNIFIEFGMVKELATPLGLGITLGLILGKPIGIGLTSLISVKSGIASLPSQATWMHIIGVGLLAGIGFTMSIFIAILSFTGNEHLLGEAKFSILTASMLAGIIGSIFLLTLNKRLVQKSVS